MRDARHGQGRRALFTLRSDYRRLPPSRNRFLGVARHKVARGDLARAGELCEAA
jgi:hypothetical protein